MAKCGEVISAGEFVLFWHSVGGDLSQYFLSNGLGKVSGLDIMAAFPSSEGTWSLSF